MRLLINQVLHYLPRSKASDCTERVSLCLDVTLRRDDGEVIPEKHPDVDVIVMGRDLTASPDG